MGPRRAGSTATTFIPGEAYVWFVSKRPFHFDGGNELVMRGGASSCAVNIPFGRRRLPEAFLDIVFDGFVKIGEGENRLVGFAVEEGS